jgi:hypothetical protein
LVTFRVLDATWQVKLMNRPAAALALAVTLLALGCPTVETPPPQTPQKPPPEKVAWRMSKNGLGFRLSDADARDDKPPPTPKTTPLSEAEARKVLDRLPPLEQEPDDEKSFALRDKSKPAPRTGKTITDTFPPPSQFATPPPAANTTAGAPLAVTRKQPIGDVAIAPALSVSFSAPMVAITSHDDLAKTPPPITITPAPPGKWRWAGSQTAIFDPEKRFPMATDYRVEIPAGTRGANGNVLAKAETWTFSTPPPKLSNHYPSGGPLGLEPVMFAEFDQAIDAQAVLALVDMQGNGNRVDLRAATEEEIQGDDVVRRLYDKAKSDRRLAFRAKSALSTGTTYTIHFPAGLPSAEGPKRTKQDQSFSFRTYDPLRFERLWCGWDTCAPSAPWSLVFNNPLDTSKFERGMIKVSPEPESIKIDASGRNVTIRPRSRGKTKYTVTIDPAIADVFGQTLGKQAKTEIQVDPAEPYLFPEENAMSVLDPEGAPALPVFSVNRAALDVKLYSVGADDWERYEKWRQDWDNERKAGTPPGKLVTSRVVRPAKKDDELVATPIDLTPALNQGLGQVLVIVEPQGGRPKDPWSRQWVRAWVQVTKLGVDALFDTDSMVVWTTRLADGAPVEGVEASVFPSRASGTSGADGLARLALGDPGALVLAKKGGDLALLPPRWRWSTAFARRGVRDEIRWLVFDDRGMYKPGEELRAKGWLRKLGMAKGGDVDAIPAAQGRTVRWTIHDARNVELGKGSSTVDASGGFDLSFKLPGTPNLGSARISFELEGLAARAEHAFSIEEFRRPEFEVSARPGEGPHFVGGHTNVAVNATYYAGGGLPNAEAAWVVTRSDARFVPPNRGDFAFGKASEPWWVDRRKRKEGERETWSGRTDPAGEQKLRVDFDALEPPYPMNLAFEATVTDVNRQAWTARASVLVHPANVYVGVKQERTFVQAGEQLGLEVIAADIDGALVPGREVTVKSARVDWKMEKGEYVEVEADPDTCSIVSAAQPVRCSLKTKDGGRYKIVAVVTDEHGRKNQTETHLWVLGSSTPPDSTLGAGTARIIPAKPSFKAGETAELLVMAPFAPAEGLLAIERQGVVHVERFKLASTTGTVRFAVDAAWTPNITARVLLAGASTREDARGEPDPKLPKKPAYAVGLASIKVPPVDRQLDVAVKPRDSKLDPGGTTTVDLDVHDDHGAPVANGTAALVVVDESVLALSDYKTPDPLAVFYSDRPANVDDLALRERVLVARAEDKRLQAKAKEERGRAGAIGRELGKLDGNMVVGGGSGLARLQAKSASAAPAASAAPMAAPAPPPKASPEKKKDVTTLEEVSTGEPNKPIAMRKDLSALALFAPAVATDARGHASVEVKLPDSLTRYRVMAVVVAGDKMFGSAESSITARLPLMVRPSAPRFLNFGDRFDLPVVLQNQTDKALDVDVAARAANARFTGAPGIRVTVPANDRVEVRLPAAAAKPGKARFQIGVASGRFADAQQLELPVWTPATTEAFATYGTIDEGAIAQPVKMPSAVEPSFGGIEITTSSTAVSALTDAVLYLVRYPFECNEQISSRVMAIAALRDVLTAFESKDLPPRQVLIDSIAKDLDKLRARQHWSGGFSFWTSDFEPWPYLSVHVAHALVRAKEKGFKVPPEMLDKSRTYLRNIERHIPHYYSRESRRAIVAYALYVRNRMGDADPAKARALIAEAGGVDKVQMDALGWIWPTIAGDPKASAELAEIRRVTQNRVTETAGAAHFVTSYEDGAYVLLGSDRRADGILLEAMIGDQPKNDLIPKLVTGLLAHKKAGRWSSTQENAFVLLALDRYFNTYEKVTPDFVARAWLGDRYAGEHAFKGRGTDRHQIDVPMRALAEIGGGNVVVQKDGQGRLYYRVGMTYAPSDLRPPPAEHGFSVSRVYEHVDDPGDVKRDADGTWRVKAGTKVRVRVTMVAPARRYHVALVDPLPAGLEVMNPALAVTGSVPADPKAEPSNGMPWWWSRTWYEHQNMRDERVEAFAPLVWDGVYEYTYVARATTPGTFVVPPPKAEEMYSPETFGRGAGDRLIVE